MHRWIVGRRLLGVIRIEELKDTILISIRKPRAFDPGCGDSVSNEQLVTIEVAGRTPIRQSAVYFKLHLPWHLLSDQLEQVVLRDEFLAERGSGFLTQLEYMG